MGTLRYDPDRRPTRRQLLGTGGAGALAAVAVAGCDALSTNPTKQGQGRKKQPAKSGGGTEKEAPQLASQAKSGDIPPVEERLPKEPMQVTPVERSGEYGGSWHTAMLGTSDTAWLTRTIGYEGLMRWTTDWSGEIPNVAKSIEATADAREFTITLREGMKWSDGEPFTADDIDFAFNDVLGNTDLTPVLPSFLMSGKDTPAKLTKVDDQTVKLVFAKPNGLFQALLARSYEGALFLSYPKHYLQDFHVKFNPDAKKEAKKARVPSWTDLFFAKADPWGNKDLPRLHPWKVTVALGEGNRMVAERNPYYFKTDTDGRQLPYVDSVTYDVVQNTEVILLKASNGEFDLHTRHINNLPNKPVLARNRSKGHYDFVTLKSSWCNEFIVNLNLTHQDPVKREIFGNRDFRIGLSYAINREEMIDAVFQRQGEPWQAAPARESQFYNEKLATQYTEFDLDKANQHLDAAGYRSRDSEGFRLGPDGKRISFDVEVATPALVSNWVDSMNLIVGYWKKVGIESHVRSSDRSLFEEHIVANKHDAAVWNGDSAGLHDEMFDPRYYFAFSGDSYWCVPWAEWFSSHGASGEKPPAAPLKQIELFWKLMETPSEDDRNALFTQVLDIAQQEFFVIGTIRVAEGYGIKRTDFHNVPDGIPDSWVYVTPAPTNPEQFFTSA